MFIYSVRASKLKAALCFVVCAALIVCATAFFARKKSVYQGDVLTNVKNADPASFEGIKNTRDGAEFLARYGWKVEDEPVKIAQVRVPEVFDAVYEKYNQIQIAQQLDLNKYKGKEAKLYTYAVTNYEYNGTVLANLLICGDRVIAADLCSADVNGFMHGLSRENCIVK